MSVLCKFVLSRVSTCLRALIICQRAKGISIRKYCLSNFDVTPALLARDVITFFFQKN